MRIKKRNTRKLTRAFSSRLRTTDANSLDGTIPPEITKLTSLRELNMNFNDNVRGKLPSDIGKLSLLQRLEFSRNLLTGEIPASICDMTFLRQLHFGYNTLIGEIPSCIGSLVNLQLLFVSEAGTAGRRISEREKNMKNGHLFKSLTCAKFFSSLFSVGRQCSDRLGSEFPCRSHTTSNALVG